MGSLREVPVGTLAPGRFREVLGERYDEIERAVARAEPLFRGRVVWHVNSTARGGGVVELLQSLLAYARGAGVDARWAVIEGDPEFFAITKRIHNRLHGASGDGGALAAAEHERYEATLRESSAALAALLRPGDIVFVHDPQTAGMVAPLRATGALVVWRCHVGLDLPNELAREAWGFLRPYVVDADAFVFSRREFVWEGLEDERVWIVAPSIDAFSPKNQDLDRAAVDAIVRRIGLIAGPAGESTVYTRQDGTPSRVDRQAEIDQEAPLPEGAALIAQVSRWDRLKDPLGVMEGFCEHVDRDHGHLLLAGPEVAAVSDDPEGAAVLAEVRERRVALAPVLRARVHLACLPMADTEENAAMVNAIQRRSDIIVQKSLAEGFGLTVAEAMWKSRPVIASAVGGIHDQIVDRESGILLEDPTDLPAFGAALRSLLDDPTRREALGAAARLRVEENFLGTRHLVQYIELLKGLLEER